MKDICQITGLKCIRCNAGACEFRKAGGGMTERENEIHAILAIVQKILEEANLSLTTKKGVPLLIKDHKDGKFYAINGAGEQK